MPKFDIHTQMVRTVNRLKRRAILAFVGSTNKSPEVTTLLRAAVSQTESIEAVKPLIDIWLLDIKVVAGTNGSSLMAQREARHLRGYFLEKALRDLSREEAYALFEQYVKALIEALENERISVVHNTEDQDRSEQIVSFLRETLGPVPESDLRADPALDHKRGRMEQLAIYPIEVVPGSRQSVSALQFANHATSLLRSGILAKLVALSNETNEPYQCKRPVQPLTVV